MFVIIDFLGELQKKQHKRRIITEPNYRGREFGFFILKEHPERFVLAGKRQEGNVVQGKKAVYTPTKRVKSAPTLVGICITNMEVLLSYGR